jgi:DNA (cytosine-5)-methyltransferase 1
MKHGSLFSGIGGFDLAAECMGWENVFHCEWNPFGQRVLHHYWPNAEQFTDITKTDFKKYANRIDILTGGFPCQPYSSAGKRLGKEDDRHLWPEMLRAIREIQPRWVVGENVLGLVNWSGGLVFHEVQTDLEAEGYEVQPYVLPAVSVNAPHRRDRVWFVAHSNNNDRRDNIRQFYGQSTRFSEEETATNTNCNGLNQCNSDNEINPSQGRVNALSNIDKSNGNGDVADTNKVRFSTKMENGKLGRQQRFTISNQRNAWNSFPTVSPICFGDDGIPDRLDSITFPKWRNESIKAGGNAIVPQVVYQIFKTIEQYQLLKAPAPYIRQSL